jgi:ATP-dependent helicase/nuclease subunit B
MPVTFILGRAGAGKTRACLDALLAELARPDDTRRLILLVPEQASFQMERALAVRAPGHGYWRAAVLSFSRLAHAVFNETGSEPPELTARTRALALRRLVAQPGAELRVLRRAAATPGFFVELGRIIEELLRENVPPAELAAAAARTEHPAGTGKVHEIAALYAAYLAWLGPQRTDAAAQLAVLRARLADVGWLHGASLWIDGFAGFTGQELETLVELARLARDVTITLLVDPHAPAIADARYTPDPLGLFQRTEVTYQRLLRLFDAARVPVAPPIRLTPPALPRFASAPQLAGLERGLAAPQDAPGAAAPAADVRMIECPTHCDELRAAARWIRTTMADPPPAGGRLRFRDFAVIARDLEPFVQTIAEVFAEYEIPYFLDRRQPMGAHPLARLVSALFEAVDTDLDVPAMVRLLRTRLLPLSREQAEDLENLVINGAVRGVTLWRQPTCQLEHGAAAFAAAYPQRLRIVTALDPLSALRQQADGATGAVWAEKLHDALEALGARDVMTAWVAEARTARRWQSAEVHRLAWEALCAVLDDLHDVLAETRLLAADVAAIVGTALAETTLGLAPPTVDQVLVSSIERSRHPDIKYAWVFAFNEGVFPARPPEDVLLSTAERDALAQAGLAAPAAHRQDAFGERLLAYIAFTRPALGLTISHATVGDDGAPLQPSPLLADVTRALPGLPTLRFIEHEPPVCLPELARQYLRVRRDDRQRSACRRYERVLDQARAQPAAAEQLAWLLRGAAYRNEPPPLGNYRHADEMHDVIWRTSPSEVETYLQCPFKHFARFGLHLDPARGPQPLRWDLGSVAHELLADVTRRAIGEPAGVTQLSDDRWQELLADAVRQWQDRQPPDLAQRRPDFASLSALLPALLRDLVLAHAARWRRGRFAPLGCEQSFDPRGGPDIWPAAELRLPDGRRVHLHGRIDRIDQALAGNPRLLLVYDYKSTAEPVRGDFLIGKRLQLFIYLLAARRAPADAPTLPAGVFLAPLYPDLTVLDTGYVADAPPTEQLMYMFRPRGLFTAAAAQLLDPQHAQGHSPVAQMQRRNDGAFHQKADAVAAAEIDARLALAEQTVLFAADGVASGRVDVAPLVEKRTLACRTCDFPAVCRFDRAFNRPRLAEAVLPRLAGTGEAEGGADEAD